MSYSLATRSTLRACLNPAIVIGTVAASLLMDIPEQIENLLWLAAIVIVAIC
jgi:hypothetical protein